MGYYSLQAVRNHAPGGGENMGYFLLAEAVDATWCSLDKIWVNNLLVLSCSWQIWTIKQKAKTFEFVHNRLNAGLSRRIRVTPPGWTSVGEFCNSRCPDHFPEFGTGQTMSSEGFKGIRWQWRIQGELGHIPFGKNVFFSFATRKIGERDMQPPLVGWFLKWNKTNRPASCHPINYYKIL